MNYSVKLKLEYDGTIFDPRIISVHGVPETECEMFEKKQGKKILKALNLNSDYKVMKIERIESIHFFTEVTLESQLNKAAGMAEELEGLIFNIKENL